MPYKRKGSSFWQISVGGIRQSSGTSDYEAAKALEHKLNHDSWVSTRMAVKPRKSFKELVLKWSEEKSGKRSWEDDLRKLRWWDRHLGNVTDIVSINREMIDSIIRQHRLVTPESPCSENATANRYVVLIGAMLNAACREWDWIERSPKLRKYPENAGNDAWLTVDQWRALEAELPAHLRRAATFALATGMRDSKVFGLEWRQIDMHARWLRFSGTANKLGNTIPLNATAMEVLHGIHGSPVCHISRVFTWQKPCKVGDTVSYTVEPLSDYGKAWWKALERAGLGSWESGKWRGFTWHGLRHTFASWLGQAGVEEGVIDRLCGWKGSGATRRRYTHLAVDHLHQYAAVIDTLLAQSTGQLRHNSM